MDQANVKTAPKTHGWRLSLPPSLTRRGAFLVYLVRYRVTFQKAGNPLQVTVVYCQHEKSLSPCCADIDDPPDLGLELPVVNRVVAVIVLEQTGREHVGHAQETPAP
jgi:hypothetical protein